MIGYTQRRAVRVLPKRWFRRALDPARAARVYAEFDERRGYAAYHELCRRLAPRSGVAPSSDLETTGAETFALMPPAAAMSLLESAAAGGSIAALKKDSKHLEGFRITETSRVEAILAAALPPVADQRIAAFFGSEYLVHWFTVTRTPPAEQQDSVSFLWHCDRGPRDHLKLLLYLNATRDHGGNTEFLDLADTVRVGEAGYLFGPTEKRTGDLEEISRRVGCALRPRRFEIDAGGALLFQPSSVLHRGISPTRGPRFVVTLCLLPSPAPWREALRRGTCSDLAEDEKWHVHAAELGAKLGLDLTAGERVARREDRP